MQDELGELLETAMYKEVASEAYYIAGQERTNDPGAKALMKELAAEEHHHSEVLKGLKEQDWQGGDWHRERVPDLMISEHLVGGDSLAGAGLQETLLFAMKREQESVEFYSRMMGALRNPNAKALCQRMVHEELTHKLRLELLYDELFLAEN